MALRTIEQATSDAILANIKRQGSSNTTYLIDVTAPTRKQTVQNFVADEGILDATVTQRKLDVVPLTFGPTDVNLILYGDKDWMDVNDVTTRLQTVADVTTIFSYGPQITVILDLDGNQLDGIEDFELTSTEDIDVGREHETLQIFTRRKVRV